MTTKLGPFLGINNRLPDHALLVDAKTGEAFLRTAENVDIDNARAVRRRTGRTRVQPLTNPHSLKRIGGRWLMVIGLGLYEITLPAYSQTLLKVLTSTDPMSYEEWSGDVYFSNGTDAGRISASGQVFPWAMPSPAQPVVSTIAGSLLPGTYQVALTYVNTATGEESGCAGSNNYDLTAAGALRVALPAGTPGATHVRIYCSPVNGGVLIWQATVALGASSYDITAVSLAGAQCTTLYQEPLPPGRQVAKVNGRLCSISGKLVYLGTSYRPGYYLPSEGFIAFPGEVSNIVPAQTGTYVVADMTYWFPGADLQKPEGPLADVLPYGGVPGTAFKLPNNSRVGWFGARGLVIADTQGAAEAVMSDNIDLVAPASGFSAVIGEAGYWRILSCGWAVNATNLAATTYSNFAFTSISEGYGTLADGLYALAGADDAGAEILAKVSFGKVDFGSEALKLMPAAYAGFASESPLSLTVGYVDETGDFVEYDYPTRAQCQSLAVQRFDTGKGLRANWFELAVSNTDGADFQMAFISFEPSASQRRI